MYLRLSSRTAGGEAGPAFMAFLDKFNDWYVRSIPETGPGISVEWQEPVAGTRYRWKQNREARIIMLIVVFLLGLVVPLKHGRDLSFGGRLLLSCLVTGCWALLGWAFKNAPERIVLTENWLVIGAGRRGAKRIRLDAAQAMGFDEFEGHPVLFVREPSGDLERVFLDPSREKEIRELLAKAGRVKSA